MKKKKITQHSQNTYHGANSGNNVGNNAKTVKVKVVIPLLILLLSGGLYVAGHFLNAGDTSHTVDDNEVTFDPRVDEEATDRTTGDKPEGFADRGDLYEVIAENGGRIRQEPKTTSRVIATLATGNLVRVTGEVAGSTFTALVNGNKVTSKWMHVEVVESENEETNDALNGVMWGGSLRKIPSYKEAGFMPAPSEQPAQSPNDEPPQLPDVEVVDIIPFTYGEILVKGLNVRDYPSTNPRVLVWGKLYRGSRIKIVARTRNKYSVIWSSKGDRAYDYWYMIVYTKADGTNINAWVHGKGIRLLDKNEYKVPKPTPYWGGVQSSNETIIKSSKGITKIQAIQLPRLRTVMSGLEEYGVYGRICFQVCVDPNDGSVSKENIRILETSISDEGFILDATKQIEDARFGASKSQNAPCGKVIISVNPRDDDE